MKGQRRSTQRYNRSVTGLIFLLLIYPTVAVLAKPADRQEIYPFFNWSLFTHASDTKSDAVLLVHEVNGRRFHPPVPIFELPDSLAVRDVSRILLAKLVEKIVRVKLAGHDSYAETLNKVMQDRYLNQYTDIEYDISIISYHPVERYVNGDIKENIVIMKRNKNDNN